MLTQTNSSSFLDLINNGSADDVFSAVNANLDGVFAAAKKTFGALTESGQKKRGCGSFEKQTL